MAKKRYSPRYTEIARCGKLLDWQIAEIVWWIRRGRGKASIARMYGVSRQVIWNIETSEAVQQGLIVEQVPKDFSLTEPIYRV